MENKLFPKTNIVVRTVKVFFLNKCFILFHGGQVPV